MARKKTAPAPRFMERAAGSPPPVAESRPQEAATRKRFWRPPGLPLRPARTDAYAVVDDIVLEPEERLVVLAVAPWPRLDEVGRFAWREGDRPRGAYFLDPDAFQERVNEARGRSMPEDEALCIRPFRVGDTFLIRGLVSEGNSISWSELVDVTSAARERAKVALYGAVAPRVTSTQMAELDLRATEPTAEPPKPRRVTSASPDL